MQVGVSSACLYPMQTEQAVETLLSMGIKKLEIFFNSYQELSPEFISSLQSRIRQAGAKVIAIHPFTSAFEPMLFFSDYSRRIEDGLMLYRHFFQAAKELGASFLVLHGSSLKRPLSVEEYAKRFERLFLLGESYQIITVQENVNGYQSQDPQFLYQLKQQLPGIVRFVLDCKQCRRAGCSLEEMIDAMGDNIVHLHLSDYDGTKDCILPGRGNFDFMAFAKRISARSPYIEGAVLELYRDAFEKAEDLSMANDFLNRIFSYYRPFSYK